MLKQGQPVRVTPSEFSVRSNLNSYGGGAMCLLGHCAYVVNAETQQIEQIDCLTGARTPITPASDACFGGLVPDPLRQRILAVREGRHNHTLTQQLVAVDIRRGTLTVLAEGDNFYGAPAVSGDGMTLAWISWQLPDMPWSRSRLWTADVDETGALQSIRAWPTPVPASVQQPQFVGTQLYALSDHNGWWQPFRINRTGVEGPCPERWQSLSDRRADHANAPWQLAEQHAVALDDGSWVRVCYQQGFGELWYWPVRSQEPVRLAERYADFRALQVDGHWVYCIGRRVDAMDSVLQIDPVTEEVRVLAGGEQPLTPDACVSPRPFAFKADGSLKVSGFYYPARAQEPIGDPPPVIVMVHGGPTSAAYPVFDPQVQFWAQHGFAVAAVNYRGSTGFGRAFRQALAGNWGHSEVADVCQAVGYLGEQGLVDAGAAFIQGRSAGGYTALMALVETEVFQAGASLFGVSDPVRLRAQTHRFESGYLDWLLGPLEQNPQRWADRTPVLQAARITCPVIFFQGGQDAVVVPEQTETMVAALQAQGLAPEYHYFADEGHGFRRADRQVFMLEQLLAFYRRQCQNSHALRARLE